MMLNILSMNNYYSLEKSDKNNPVCSCDLTVGVYADSLLLDGNLVFEDE